MYAGIVRPTREGGNMVGNPVLGNWTDGFGCYQQDFQERVNSLGIMLSFTLYSVYSLRKVYFLK